MAINRQDYQYVRNTLPTNANKIGDGSLTIGDKINNLLVDLNQNSVFNSFYPEYYGLRSLEDGWNVCPDTADGNASDSLTFNLTKDGDAYTLSFVSDSDERVDEDLSNIFTIDCQKRKTTTTISKTLRATSSEGPTITPEFKPYASRAINPSIIPTYYFIWTFDLSSYLYPEEYKIASQSVGLTINGLDYNESTKILTISGSSTKSPATITLEVVEKEEYDISMTGDTSVVFNNEDIKSLTINNYSANISGVTSCEIDCDNESTSLFFSVNAHDSSMSTVSGSIVIQYANPTYESTIKEGELQQVVELKKGKSYVLSIADAIKPKGLSVLSSIKKYDQDNGIGEVVHTFDSYLFFQVPEDGKYIVCVKYVGFSYRLLGVVDSNLTDLRSFISPSEAKVFLFESDLSWIVNKNGIIVGVKDCVVQSTEETLNSGTVSLTWTDDDVKKVFSSKPSLAISKDSVKILLPDTSINSKVWKHFVFWDSFKEKTESINELVLLAYRDYLIPTTRRWGEINYTTRYGAVKTIQRTCVSKYDKYSNDEGEISRYKIRINPIHLSDHIKTNKTTSINLTLQDEEKISKTNALATFSLENLSLMGYNNDYCNLNNLCGSEDMQIGYKYTTICFAWGVATYNSETGVYNRIERISDFSNPIFIDRQLVKITSDDDDYILTANTASIQYALIGEYYPDEKVILVGSIE